MSHNYATQMPGTSGLGFLLLFYEVVFMGQNIQLLS